MPRATSYHYEGNVATLKLAEGAWTDDSDYKIGGYFATPIAKGELVEIDADWRVKQLATAANAIGILEGEPYGERVTNGRNGTIRLFCDQVIEIDLSTTSDAITRGASIKPTDKDTWELDSVANDTYALVAAASGSGDTIPVMFGRWTL